MPNNLEYVSRFLSLNLSEPFRHSEIAKGSRWGKVIEELERASIRSTLKMYPPAPDWLSEPNPQRFPHVAHFNDFIAWINYEGYTMSWQDVWLEWRALGLHYKTTPPVDGTLVSNIIKVYEPPLIPRPTQGDIDIFDTVEGTLTFAVARTYLNFYENSSKLRSDTVASIHWMDWMRREGYAYSSLSAHIVLEIMKFEIEEGEQPL